MTEPFLVIVVVMALERFALVVMEYQEVHPASVHQVDPSRSLPVLAALKYRTAWYRQAWLLQLAYLQPRLVWLHSGVLLALIE